MPAPRKYPDELRRRAIRLTPGRPGRPGSGSRRGLPPPAPGPGCRTWSRFGAAAVIGAQRYERTPQRTNRRNGKRLKTVATTAGEVELAIPKLRTGSFFPSLLHPRRRVDKAQMRRDLLRVDRGGLHPQGLATSSRPWATSRASAAPRSQGSARTSTRACTSSCPAAWTAPGSPTSSWTPPTWTCAWGTGWSAGRWWWPPACRPKGVGRSWAWPWGTPRRSTSGRPCLAVPARAGAQGPLPGGSHRGRAGHQ